MLSRQEKEERVLKMLNRIMRSDDGPELLEYLTDLSLMNYRAFKQSNPDADEFCKGYAVCVDSIIETMKGSGQKLAEIQNAKEQVPPEDEDGQPVNPHE